MPLHGRADYVASDLQCQVRLGETSKRNHSEEEFARCRRQNLIDSWRVQGNARCHILGVPESKISVPAIAQR